MQESSRRTIVMIPASTRLVRELTLEQARDLLDWLEARGIHPSDISLLESGLFTVSWMAAPGIG